MREYNFTNLSSCFACRILNKSRKEVPESGFCYRYGCDCEKRSYICGWICNDNELKTMGCSDFESLAEMQMKLF